MNLARLTFGGFAVFFFALAVYGYYLPDMTKEFRVAAACSLLAFVGFAASLFCL